MKTFNVQITATITKTIRVTTECEDSAYDEAHELFNARIQNDFPDFYSEKTKCTIELKS